MPTVAQIVTEIYPVAQYLATIDIYKGGLSGGGVDIGLSEKISNIGRSVKRIYDVTPNDTTLFATANCLYGICGIYGTRAQALSGTSGVVAGIVPPPAGLPQPIDWRVSGTASATAPLATGDTSVVLDGTNGMPDLRGYNVAYTRGGIPQYTTNPGDGSNYYGWDRLTGLFQLLGSAPSAVLGEQMRIDPIS